MVAASEEKIIQKPMGGRNPDGTFAKGHANGWKPGQSGNPGGKFDPEKRQFVSGSLTRFLNNETLASLRKMRKLKCGEEIARSLILRAVSQSKAQQVAAAQEIMDRCEGKVPNEVKFRDVTEDPEVLLRDLLARGYEPDNQIVRDQICAPADV